jgi:hypothetical protein
VARDLHLIPRGARVSLALSVLAALAAFAFALWIGAVCDDAGISLAYARVAAAGEGLRLTPLSPRVEAYSNPLWTLWLALGFLLRAARGDGASFALLSGALCGALAVFVIGLVPSRLRGDSPLPLDALAPWLLALDTTYACWNGAGLESGAFALVLALSMLLIDSSATPLGLLPLLRPEGPLYVAALALLRGRRLLRLRWWVFVLAPFLAWLIFRLVYYGQWFPNAYYAKHGWDYGGTRYLTEWFLNDRWHWALLACPIALWIPRLRRTFLVAALPALAAVAFILISRGDWMSEHRFVAHALPAVALLAGLVPALLPRGRWLAALLLLAVAALDARAHAPGRKADPPLPLDYIASQGRWFHDAAARLGLTRPRIAHFDLGGVALWSGGEAIDLAGLADLYIGRVGYQDHSRVRDYILDEVRPELINLHGPCAYIGDDPRFQRDYALAATGLWGANYLRREVLARSDARCGAALLARPAAPSQWTRPPDAPPDSALSAARDPVESPRALPPARDPVESVRALSPEALLSTLSGLDPASARDLWLCARAHRPAATLPDVRALASAFAARAANDPATARALLDAAITLDPTLTGVAQRLLQLRLAAVH